VTRVDDAAVRVVTCTSDAPWEPPLVQGLQRHELGIHLVRRCVDHGELLGVALRDRPRAAIVAADVPWLDRELVGALQEHGVAVIAVDGTGRRPLERVGVTHRLAPSASAEEVAALLHRLEQGAAPVAARPPAPASGPAGRLVAVWGGAGSPGRTTVAVHAAAALAGDGVRAVLVDADVWSAAVAQLLELDEAPSIAQAARLAADGWPEPWSTCVQRGPNGVEVLAGLARAELWPEIREHAWRAVLDAVRAEAEIVVVDLAAPIEEDEELSFDRVPHRRNLVTRIVLELADEVLLVVAADPIGLRRGIVAHRTLAEALPRVGSRATVVLNRIPAQARRVQEASAAVSEWTGAPPRALLPVEPAFDRVRWEGRPLAAVRRRSPWLRELRGLVGGIAAPLGTGGSR
jgi:MinD-like ATPase involved in chromosome partitioning or flagellar assembly